MTDSKLPPRPAVRETGTKASSTRLQTLPVHGHIFRPPFTHVMFVGRNSKLRALVVIYRGGKNVYVYKLGDSYDPRLCCKLAQLPHPGEFINQQIKKFPVEIFG